MKKMMLHFTWITMSMMQSIRTWSSLSLTGKQEGGVLNEETVGFFECSILTFSFTMFTFHLLLHKCTDIALFHNFNVSDTSEYDFLREFNIKCGKLLSLCDLALFFKFLN